MRNVYIFVTIEIPVELNRKQTSSHQTRRFPAVDDKTQYYAIFLNSVSLLIVTI